MVQSTLLSQGSAIPLTQVSVTCICCVLQLQKTTSELEKTKEELKSTQKDLKNADKEILVRISFLMASCQLLQTGLQLQSQELCWLLLSD